MKRAALGAGLLIALCLPAAVVMAVAPKRWPVKIDGRRAEVPIWLGGGTITAETERVYRDCNLSDGRSSRPFC